VLINLLGNSVKFTEALGAVSLIVEVSGLTSQRATLVFTVRDNGIGMTEEQVDRLFTAFEQADGTISKRFGGTGLGLAISQRLVKEMGGMITVKSSLSHGSDFIFSLDLPIEEDSEVFFDAKNNPGEVAIPDLSGKRILLAEDILINRIILKELLRDTHVEVEEQENGQDAVDAFAKTGQGYFDLIIMDIQMPGINGYEAATLIRAMNRPDATTVPIIAMTANAYREDVEKAMQVGMNAHLSKPMEVDRLMLTLRKYLLDQ